MYLRLYRGCPWLTCPTGCARCCFTTVHATERERERETARERERGTASERKTESERERAKERERQRACGREIKQASRYHDGTSTLLWLACLGFRLVLARDFRSIESIGGSMSVCSRLPSPGRMYFDERFCPSCSLLASRAACLGGPGDLSRHPPTHTKYAMQRGVSGRRGQNDDKARH